MIVETKRGKMPVRWGMNALARFGDLTGKTMNEVMKSMGSLGKMKISELLAFVYVGFADGARFAGEECLVKSVDDVGDMIDEDSDLVNKMFDAFNGDSEVSKGEGKKK